MPVVENRQPGIVPKILSKGERNSVLEQIVDQLKKRTKRKDMVIEAYECNLADFSVSAHIIDQMKFISIEEHYGRGRHYEQIKGKIRDADVCYNAEYSMGADGLRSVTIKIHPLNPNPTSIRSIALPVTDEERKHADVLLQYIRTHVSRG